MDLHSRAASERFWSKVSPEPNTGCWFWTACVNRNGYGEFRAVKTVRVLAHRYAWEEENGPVPAGINVLHYCDTPGCVNPGHLFLGTQTDNARDAAAKGRLVQQRHPERMSRGDAHYSRTHPERLARGDRNGSRAHPERLVRGTAVSSAVLDEERVQSVRARLAAGCSSRTLAREHGVSRGCIDGIKRGRTWKHVPTACT